MEEFLVKKLGRLNYQSLLHLIRKNRIELVPVKLAGAYGMTTPDRIYVDLDELKKLPDNVVFFVILHEIFHYKRYQVLGKKYFVEIFSSSDFNTLHQHILKEEQAADRYGRLIYRKFNGADYPVEFTQMLDDPYKQERYEKNTRMLFGQIKNEANFDTFWNKFIVN